MKENLSRIAEAHPRSALAERHGNKSIKDIKTKQVVEKTHEQEEEVIADIPDYMRLIFDLDQDYALRQSIKNL